MFRFIDSMCQPETVNPPRQPTHLSSSLPIHVYCMFSGFTNGALKACYGGEGRYYNVDPSVRCGDASTTVCDEPDTYVSWDGIQLTEAAYRIISKNLFSTPQFKSLCSTKEVWFDFCSQRCDFSSQRLIWVVIKTKQRPLSTVNTIIKYMHSLHCLYGHYNRGTE
ncbi:putative sinapine esterase [Helianthus anomalus]